MSRGPTKQGAPYTRYEIIGRGSYGIVYKGIHNETRSTVAIKVLNLDTAEDEVSDIQKEIVLLQSLKAGDAQNVVRYHGSFLHGSHLWIIMDYCEGGSIRTLMKVGRIEEKYITVIIREVLAALNYIHKSDIIHRDVKAANILVTNDGRVQLCDFGVAAQLAANHFKRNTFVGTPYWMAPEVISDGLSYNFKADIWSLGITVYEIATGSPPYADQEPMRAIFLIPRSSPPRLEGTSFSTQLREFVATCLAEKPDDRPAAADLMKMKCIKNISKTPTSIMRELIHRYEIWRNGGGIRKSLAMGGDLDVDDEFDGQFGLDDDSSNGQDSWDFGTARRSMWAESQSQSQPTWEQSADATEDLLKTIRPTGASQTPASLRQGSSANTGGLVNGSSSGSTFEHPLMKLFGSQSQTSSAKTGLVTQSMTDLTNGRNGLAQSSLASFADGETVTPVLETVSIEMPDINATCLPSASSVSLPVLSSVNTPIASEIPSIYNARDRKPFGLAPSRQNSQDHFGGSAIRSVNGNNHVVPPLSLPTDIRMNLPKTNDGSNGASASTQPGGKSADSPAFGNVKDSSPVERSRPSSPTRSLVSNPLSPPSSPSRSLQSYTQQISTPSTGTSLKNGFNASLSHPQQNGSTLSLPDILPRPSINGALRERSPSSSAVPQVSKHVRKPSNLVLQLPSLLDRQDNLSLAPSSPGSQGLVSTITNDNASVPLQSSLHLQQQGDASSLDLMKNPTRTPTRKPLVDLPPLKALDLGVLSTKDQDVVIGELSRVVEDMLLQLTHIEEGLTTI